MLSIGAALLGSSQVIGVDVDPDALELAQQNCDDFDDPLPVGAAFWGQRPRRARAAAQAAWQVARREAGS
jgi:predicted RNA methylase